MKRRMTQEAENVIGNEKLALIISRNKVTMDNDKPTDNSPIKEALADNVIPIESLNRAQRRQLNRGEIPGGDQKTQFGLACKLIQKAKIPLMIVAIIDGECQVYSSVDSKNSDDVVDLFKHMLDEFKNSKPPEDQGTSSVIWTPSQK